MKSKVDVLVVDDDSSVTYILRQLLDDLGLRASFASNGREGYERALDLHPRLILSDVMMPLMRGDEMLRVLRENENTAAIPCILMTSATTELHIRANDFLAKPFDLDQLESLLMRHLG